MASPHSRGGSDRAALGNAISYAQDGADGLAALMVLGVQGRLAALGVVLQILLLRRPGPKAVERSMPADACAR